jgi:hypothetical protein
MARIAQDSSVTESISLGAIAAAFPAAKVHAVLGAMQAASIRQRDLPAHVVVYYVIALALFMQSSYREVLRLLLEGVRCLIGRSADVNVACKSAISQARTRLGWQPMRRLHDDVVKPIAVRATRGAWYRGWRLVSLDGSTFDVADQAANEAAFGSARRQPRRQCLPANPLRLARRERHPCGGTRGGLGGRADYSRVHPKNSALPHPMLLDANSGGTHLVTPMSRPTHTVIECL